MRSLVLFSSAALLFVGLFAPPSLAQDKNGKKDPKDLALIKLNANAQLSSFLEQISKATGKPLLYNPNDPKIQNQKIGAGFTHAVPKDEVFSTFRAILAFYDLMLVPIGPKGYEIYLVVDARSSQTVIRNKAVFVDYRDLDKYSDQDGLYISTTVPLHYIENLTTLRTALSNMSTPALGRVHEVPGSQSLIIVDFAPTVWAMVQLIKQMDKEPEGTKLRLEFVELKYAYAADVADIIEQLVTAQRQAMVQSRGNQPSMGPKTPEPHVLAYEPKNALVISASEDDYELIKGLIDKFDQPGTEASQVDVVRLSHVEAKDLADTLNQVLEGMGGSLPGAQQIPGRPVPTRPTQRGFTRTGGRTQSQPTVVPDESTNSLILAADRKTIQALKEIILQLDQPKDQVLIEAALINLTRQDNFQLGVELVGIDSHGLNNSSPSGFGVTNFGLSTFQDTNGDGIPDLNVPTALTSTNGGLVAGIFRNGGIPVLLQAVQRLSNAKIVSMPSAVTYDNEGATLKVESKQPVGQQTELSSGSLSTGFSDYVSAGVTLVVSPHISADNYLRLQMHLEVSNFTGASATAGLPPPQTTNTIDTTVAVPDGHTVVMGGLISDDDSVTEDKVPILGDIPVLGYLFKNKGRGRTKRDLFIFVTPHILRQNGTDFDELHRQSWIAKMRADQLIGPVDIPGSNFRYDPRYRAPGKSGGAQLDISSLVDAGRFQEVPAQQALLEIQRLRQQAARQASK